MEFRPLIRTAFIIAAALCAQGCAAIPVAVGVGAMGVIPGDADAPEAEGVEAAVETSHAREPGVPSRLPRLSALAAQQLAPGACALFLFSRGQESEFLAFAPADGSSLTLRLDNDVRTLQARAPLAESATRFEQTYRAEGGLEARVTATLGEALPQGRRAPEAALRLSAPGGAAQVTPLTGLLACEAE